MSVILENRYTAKSRMLVAGTRPNRQKVNPSKKRKKRSAEMQNIMNLNDMTRFYATASDTLAQNCANASQVQSP